MGSSKWGGIEMKKTYYNIVFHNPKVKNDVGGLCEKAFALENELTKPQLSAAKKLFKQGKNPFIWIIEHKDLFFGKGIELLQITKETYKDCSNDKEFYHAMEKRFGYQVIDGCRVYDDHKDCVICDNIRAAAKKKKK